MNPRPLPAPSTRSANWLDEGRFFFTGGMTQPVAYLCLDLHTWNSGLCNSATPFGAADCANQCRLDFSKPEYQPPECPTGVFNEGCNQDGENYVLCRDPTIPTPCIPTSVGWFATSYCAGAKQCKVNIVKA